MNANQPSVEGRLLPPHLKELRASGLNDQIILAAGIHSETDRVRLAIHLRRNKYPRTWGPAIVYPFRDLNGDHRACRIKPDYIGESTNGEDRPKYLSPSESGVLVYFPPGVADRLESTENDLILTEGEKKSLRLVQEGFTAIGLTGVTAWHKKNSMKLLPELCGIKWKGRRVLICFDSDAVDNPQVQHEETLLAGVLKHQHGADVRVIRLPGDIDAETGIKRKVGVDDYLVAHHVNDFHVLVEQAHEPEEPDPDDLRLTAKDLEPAEEVQRYLRERMADGVNRLAFWRGDFWLWKGGCWQMQKNTDLRADLVCYLNCRYSNLTVHHANNCVMQLQAQAHVMPWIEQPGWLTDDGHSWQPKDVLPMRNALVHLPSYVDGISTYSIPPTPKFFSPTVLTYEWEPAPQKPTAWLAFLHSLWGDDIESIGTLQEWFGYTLTGDTSQQKMLTLIGPKRGGKGTVCRVLQGMLGAKNCCGPTLASFGTNFGLWPLWGKSLAIINDARLGHTTDGSVVTERILSITGEDVLTVDRKMLEPVSGKLPTRLMLVSNELPRLSDSSGALASRMIVLGLSNSFYGKEDPGLCGKLLAELPGILHWSIDGWRRLRERGYFVQPESGRDLFDEMHDLSSPVGAFVAECCELSAGYMTPTEDVYKAWCSWAEGKGWSKTTVGTEAVFGRNLRAAVSGVGRTRNRKDGGRTYFYSGIKLKAEAGF